MWKFTGDRNLEYGGMFVKCDLQDYEWGYLEVTEVIDLDSACGAAGMVLIEKKTANLDKARILKGLQCVGMSVADLLRLDTDNALMAIAYAVCAYGYTDPRDDCYHPASIVVQTEDHPMEYGGWKAEKRVKSKDLKGFVESKWLD